jgi:hypothetical protein
MKTRHQLLVAAVKRAINEADPIGLLESGAPAGPTAFCGFPRSSPTIFRHHQVKGLTNQRSEPIVVDSCHLDSYPAGWTDIWRPEKDLRRFIDHGILHTGTRGQPHGDVAIVVVIVGKHGEDAPRRKERRLAVRDLLHRSRNRQAETPEALELRACVFPSSR